VGQAVDQKRQQVELTRVALAADIDKLERRIRADLDWKARLRRDGPQILAIAGGVVIVGVAVVVLRSRFGGGSDASKGAAAGRKAASERRPASIDELAQEVRALREELQGKRKKGKGAAAEPEPVWQKLAVRVASAGAAAGASMLARRYARQAQQASEHAAPGV
jgi:hypothetical protein